MSTNKNQQVYNVPPYQWQSRQCLTGALHYFNSQLIHFMWWFPDIMMIIFFWLDFQVIKNNLSKFFISSRKTTKETLLVLGKHVFNHVWMSANTTIVNNMNINKLSLISRIFSMKARIIFSACSIYESVFSKLTKKENFYKNQRAQQICS